MPQVCYSDLTELSLSQLTDTQLTSGWQRKWWCLTHLPTSAIADDITICHLAVRWASNSEKQKQTSKSISLQPQALYPICYSCLIKYWSHLSFIVVGEPEDEHTKTTQAATKKKTAADVGKCVRHHHHTHSAACLCNKSLMWDFS